MTTPALGLRWRRNPYDASLARHVLHDSEKPRTSPLAGKVFSMPAGSLSLQSIPEADLHTHIRIRRDYREAQQFTVCFPDSVRDDVKRLPLETTWQVRFATWVSMQFRVLVTAMYLGTQRNELDVVLRSEVEVRAVVAATGGQIHWGEDGWTVYADPTTNAVHFTTPVLSKKQRKETLVQQQRDDTLMIVS